MAGEKANPKHRLLRLTRDAQSGPFRYVLDVSTAHPAADAPLELALSVHNTGRERAPRIQQWMSVAEAEQVIAALQAGISRVTEGRVAESQQAENDRHE